MTNTTTLALLGTLLFNMALGGIVDIPSGWLQFGLGGLALFVTYTVVNRQGKSQSASNERQAAASERVATSLEVSVREQVVQTEVLRSLLRHAEDGARRDEGLVLALARLACSREGHPPASPPSTRIGPPALQPSAAAAPSDGR